MTQKKTPHTLPADDRASTRQVRIIRLLLLLATLLLYGQTVNYRYTLDDEIFILKNPVVQKGVSGCVTLFTKGSLSDFGIQPYRPVTLSSFAMEKSIAGNDAFLRHFLNIIFYILLLQVLFSLLRRFFSDRDPLIPGMMVLLFAVHPLHTEAVASVKGRDELFAALFGILAWLQFYPKADHAPSLKQLAAGTFLFALSMFSKESAIAFLLIVPLSLLMLKKRSVRESAAVFVLMAAVTGLYLFARRQTTAGVEAADDIPVMANILNAAHSSAEVLATKAVILFYYVKLLFLPWPLTWDYSYNQIPVADFGQALPWISVLIYGGLSLLAVLKLRKEPLISFCILFFFIASTPTNNLFFRTGSTLGERFLFVPSIAFSIALVWLLARLASPGGKNVPSFRKSPGFMMLVAVLLAFSALTLARTPDWKDNFALFSSGVEVSPNSSRCQYSLASEYMNKAAKETDASLRSNDLEKAAGLFRRSLEIYPDNFQAHYNAGICFALKGDTLQAMDHYRATVRLNPKYLSAMNNLAVLFESQGTFDSAFVYYRMAYNCDSSLPVGKRNLSNLFYSRGLERMQQQDRDGALHAYMQSVAYDPSNVMPVNNIASLYAGAAKYDSALVWLLKGYDLDRSNLMVIENIAAVSYLAKQYSQAIDFGQRALAINPNARKSLGVLADTYQALGKAQEAADFRSKWAALSPH